MSDPLFVGVDGGGTSCRARIRDSEGALLGEGTGGPANARLDPKLVMGSILTACTAAVRAARLDAEDLRRAHAGFGLAGAVVGEVNKRLLRESHPFASVVIDTDAYAAWLGAHQGKDGAILILGTGSCGLAVIGGRRIYVGGWGAEVSDEASGQMLGREAIRRALWVHDGRAEPTPLANEILAHFDNSAEKIVAFATGALPADYARFAPLVFDYAGPGDALALALVTQAAADAARIITRLLEVGSPSVCLLGGLAGRLTPWLAADVRARLSPLQADAMDGAILMARAALVERGARPTSRESA
jgi:glucosamine kinase